MAQCVFQLHQLNEEIMLGIQARSRHWRFEVKAQPFLNTNSAQSWRSLCEIEEEHQVENDGRGKNRIAAKEVHFDLHGIAEPAENVDVVPSLFVVAARRIV